MATDFVSSSASAGLGAGAGVLVGDTRPNPGSSQRIKLNDGTIFDPMDVVSGKVQGNTVISSFNKGGITNKLLAGQLVGASPNTMRQLGRQFGISPISGDFAKAGKPEKTLAGDNTISSAQRSAGGLTGGLVQQGGDVDGSVSGPQAQATPGQNAYANSVIGQMTSPANIVKGILGFALTKAVPVLSIPSMALTAYNAYKTHQQAMQDASEVGIGNNGMDLGEGGFGDLGGGEGMAGFGAAPGGVAGMGGFGTQGGHSGVGSSIGDPGLGADGGDSGGLGGLGDSVGAVGGGGGMGGAGSSVGDVGLR